MQLSKNFTLEELTHSEIAARVGISNTPSEAIVRNLTRLCDEILEPLRSSIGRPLFVTSGYRSQVLNSTVRGSKHSDHLVGLAADIVAPPLSVKQLAESVRAISASIPLKQCILEYERWVHVSVQSELEVDDYPAEFLVATLLYGQTQYSKWEA